MPFDRQITPGECRAPSQSAHDVTVQTGRSQQGTLHAELPQLKVFRCRRIDMDGAPVGPGKAATVDAIDAHVATRERSREERHPRQVRIVGSVFHRRTSSACRGAG
nr:hypothetical protein [Solimonas terrae]